MSQRRKEKHHPWTIWHSLPAPGDGVPLTLLRGSGVMGDGNGNGMLRLLLLWGLENPLREGEWEPSSPPSPPLLFSGSSGGSPPCTPRFRLSRPSMASSRLCSRPPFPSNNEDKSVLSVSLCNPRPPPRPFRAPRGELWALGVLRERGGEGWGGYGEFWEFGIRSCHTGGGVELQRREGGLRIMWKFQMLASRNMLKRMQIIRE